ncbi:hypothetical protein SELMODRAFT_98610, partial [Selaginella moellendorffii]
CDYTITIKTGCVYLAGTDANVEIILFSLSGVVIRYNNLDNKNHDDFEYCNMDVFHLIGSCLSEYDKICKIIISHDNSGAYAGWYIDWVDVSSSSTDFAHILI